MRPSRAAHDPRKETVLRKRHAHPMFILAATLAFGALASVPAAAQVQGLPRVSPKSVAVQTIGMTDVSVEYHRPSVRERPIWGTIVPYGQVWRAGANENTTLTTEHDIEVEGNQLAAGTYGVHVMPQEDGPWTVIFSNDSHAWGSFFYDEADDALRVEVEPEEAPHREWMAFEFDELDTDKAVLALRWEKVRLPISISVDTHDYALAHLREQLEDLPSFFWWGWRDAAQYCLANDVNLDEGLEWAERSIGMQEGFSNLAIKAGLLEKLDRGDEAEPVLAKALESGNQNEIGTMGFQYLNQQEFDKAIVFLEVVADRYPETWWAYGGLGRAFQGKGDKDKARNHYNRALELAPDPQKGQVTAALAALEEAD